MKPARFEEIKALVELHDKLDNVAFVEALQNAGVDERDLIAYTRERDKRDRSLRAARRR